MLELVIIGNLGKDAEVKNINGKEYLVFSVCHSQKYTDNAGQAHETATWVSCYKSLPTNLQPYLKKGTQVFIRGDFSFKQTTYKGQNYVNINCQVSRLQLLSSPNRTSNTQQQDAALSPLPEDELPY